MESPKEFYFLRDTIALEAYLKKLGNIVVYDTESSTLGKESILFGISLFDGTLAPAYIFIDNPYYDGIPKSDAIRILNPYLQQWDVIGHNCKYDLFVNRKEGFADFKIFFDTLIAAHLLDTERLKKLEKLVWTEFGVEKRDFEQIIGKKWPKISWSEEGIFEKLARYSCEDSYWTYRLWEKFSPQLSSMSEQLNKLYQNIELPLSYCLRDMYYEGVRVDLSVLREFDEAIGEGLIEVKDKIFDEAGCQFNINSFKQKAEVLFDRLGLPTLKSTASGARSTDKKVLEKLAGKGYKVAEFLMEYSELNKLKTGYTEAIPRLISKDGRLRAEFNSCGTETGRFSSSNPNLQNQPNNARYPIRKAFVPRSGYTMLGYDYSQIEYRFMGHCSKDERIVGAFNAGFDFHAFIAESLGITRKEAKIVNFGIMYGMGYKSLASFLKIPEAKAKAIIEDYHEQFMGYSVWANKTEVFAQTHGYVKNIFGRVRHLPNASSGLKDENYFAALRQAVNTVIQGATADFIKLAMVKAHKEMIQNKWDAYMLLQVHDELIFECNNNVPGRYYYVEEFADTIKTILENPVKLIVPTPVDMKVIENWGSMKDDDTPSLYRTREEFSPITYLTWQ